MAEHPRRRVLTALILVIVGVGVLFVLLVAVTRDDSAYDGDDSGGGAPAPAPTATGVDPTGDGAVPPTDVPGSHLDEMRACFNATEELNIASVSYRSTVALTRDDTETYTVTLASIPLGEPGTVSEELRVACTISARLVASASDLEIGPDGWIEQQYLSSETTRWTWVVTGKEAGETEAVLEVRPAIRIADSSGSTQVEDLRTEQFAITFDTATTPVQKLTSLWAVLVTAATGVGAVLGAWFLVRRSTTRRDDASPAAKV